MITMLVYFLVGVLQDFLLTLNWRYIAKDKIVPATVLSFIVTITSMLVLYNIFMQLDKDRSLTAIIVYALGIAVGTVLGMKTKIGQK
jgi:uncharacterized protein YebE (UPF0316 family)